MKLRSVLALCALALALALPYSLPARAAPSQIIWESTGPVQVWPRAATGAASDTLPRFGTISTGDSLVVTDSVNVMGARYVLLLAVGSGSDTLTAFQLQTQLPSSTTWVGSGGVNFLPYSGFTIASNVSSSGVSGFVRAVWAVYNETTVGGSTPLPMVNTFFRWRFKSANARRYNSANQATLAPTGNITIYAVVWR